MRRHYALFGWIVATLLGASGSIPASATEIRVAVAANFRATLDKLTPDFTSQTGLSVAVTSGSSGQLFAQIVNGAPHDVFLSADTDRPMRLIDQGIADADSLSTYAVGRLFFAFPDHSGERPTSADFEAIRTLSIANPRLAPYGAAAVQAMGHMPLSHARVAQAQNAAGVLSAVRAGAVDAGFAALSNIDAMGDAAPTGWVVPSDLHDPVLQAAVILKRSADRRAAWAFLGWLTAEDTRATIRAAGYDVD